MPDPKQENYTMNNATQMYALDLDQCSNLISVMGHKRTIVAIGDMGNGKSAMLDMVAKAHPDHIPIYFDVTTKVDAGDLGLPRVSDVNDGDYFRHVTAEDLGFHHDKPIILMLDEIGKNKFSIR